MLGGNNGNPVVPVFLDENSFQYQTNASNQLQLFGNCKPISHSINIFIFTICLLHYFPLYFSIEYFAPFLFFL